jgi:ribosome-associated translation inhibitor RaiA
MADNEVSKGVEPRGPAQGMGFELHCPDFPLPDDVAEHTREKLLTRLARFGHQVTEVVVHLKDINGARGGDGTLCHIEARLGHHEPVNVAERHHDLRAGIDVAVERLSEAVQRHLSKLEGKRRHQERKIVRPSKAGL